MCKRATTSHNELARCIINYRARPLARCARPLEIFLRGEMSGGNVRLSRCEISSRDKCGLQLNTGRFLQSFLSGNDYKRRLINAELISDNRIYGPRLVQLPSLRFDERTSGRGIPALNYERFRDEDGRILVPRSRLVNNVAVPATNYSTTMRATRRRRAVVDGNLPPIIPGIRG